MTSAETSFNTGKFLEHTWAMIFGEDAIAPAIPECDLVHCDRRGSWTKSQLWHWQ